MRFRHSVLVLCDETWRAAPFLRRLDPAPSRCVAPIASATTPGAPMASSVEQRLAALELEQTHLREQLVNSTAAQAGTVESMNVMWMLHSGMIIFLMQFG